MYCGDRYDKMPPRLAARMNLRRLVFAGAVTVCTGLWLGPALVGGPAMLWWNTVVLVGTAIVGLAVVTQLLRYLHRARES